MISKGIDKSTKADLDSGSCSQEVHTVCAGNESVGLSQVNGVQCKSVGKCLDEEYVKPVDIEGTKLDLALLESQMNNVVISGLAGHFDCIIKTMQSKQNDLEKTIKIQEAE